MLNRRRALTALSLLAALVAAQPASAQQAQEDTDERSITVSGDGFRFADNDIALFRLSVTTRRRTARGALGANSRTMRRIVAAVRARGVAPADIETDVVSLGRASVRGKVHFVARNGIAVTIRDLDAAGSIVDAGVRSGATNVYGPDFGLADPGLVYRDALALAFADARAKAERLAREAGLTLGAVLRIRETGVDDFDAGRGEALGQAETGGDDEAPVSPGRTRVSAGVAVTFATG